jgi:PHB/PHA accumulation regulator DNA-binding domain
MSIWRQRDMLGRGQPCIDQGQIREASGLVACFCTRKKKMLTLRPFPRPMGQRDAIDMVKPEPRVTIKRYANRRFYDTGTATYVTVEDIAGMRDDALDVVVYDAATGQDITDVILAQHRFH